jgi:hypothetical protein
MKTPREILTERHRSIGPKLDAMRQEVITMLPSSGSADALHPKSSRHWSFAATIRKGWQQLIWPSRRAWAGMAVIWLAVLGANVGMKVTSQGMPSGRPASFRDIAQALEDQQRLLAELLPPKPAAAIQASRPSAGPRSQRPTVLKAC